jgi:hypothetical protein
MKETNAAYKMYQRHSSYNINAPFTLAKAYPWRFLDRRLTP